MATILLFPSARRRRFVRSQAMQMASLSPAAADKHLRRQLRVQAEAIQRRGIGSEVVDADLRALESAIRAEFCRIGFDARGRA
jgi:hypothetical protein